MSSVNASTNVSATNRVSDKYINIIDDALMQGLCEPIVYDFSLGSGLDRGDCVRRT